MDKYVGLSAPMQSGRRDGLLAGAEGRQQKAHRRHLRHLCAGAGAQQRLLRPQFQLLRPVVLYAGAHPLRHDGQCAGKPRHLCRRAGRPGPQHRLADGRDAGVCPGAGAGRRHQRMVAGCAAESRPVCRRPELRHRRSYPVPPALPPLAGEPGLCPSDDGSGAGLCLRVRHGTHRHRQVRPVAHRQRPCGAVHLCHQAQG